MHCFICKIKLKRKTVQEKPFIWMNQTLIRGNKIKSHSQLNNSIITAALNLTGRITNSKPDYQPIQEHIIWCDISKSRFIMVCWIVAVLNASWKIIGSKEHFIETKTFTKHPLEETNQHIHVNTQTQQQRQSLWTCTYTQSRKWHQTEKESSYHFLFGLLWR